MTSLPRWLLPPDDKSCAMTDQLGRLAKQAAPGGSSHWPTSIASSAPGKAAGVLRNLLRLRAAGSVPCPPPPGPGSPTAEVAERLAIAASHPTWMVERWLQRFPAEAVVALLAHNNKWVCPVAGPVLD